jgi:uncharacterized OsmC-like protein
MHEGDVHVTIGDRGYASDITVGSHTLKGDEPESMGGGGTGPTPYDYLLAGLGACKAMTMRMYADRKGWMLGKANVSLKHKRIHAADCAECETKQGKVDRIEVTIELLGDLTDEQRERLLEIADRCPVHRTLMSEISIKSTLTA